MRILQALCRWGLQRVARLGRASQMQVPRTETMEDRAVTLRSAQSPQPTVVEVGAGVKALMRPLSEVPVVAKDQKGIQLPHQASTVLAEAVMVSHRQA